MARPKGSKNKPKGGSSGKVGNTRLSQAKNWQATLNNYSLEEIELITGWVQHPRVAGYVWQKEVGEECKTPHLHLHVEFKVKMRANALFTLKRIHWEIVKDQAASRAYCQKEETRTEGPWVGGVCPRIRPLQVLDKDKFYPWQKDIATLVDQEPDDRTITWLWETTGRVGKSAFAKWLVVKRGAIVLGGKSADVYYGIAMYMEKYGTGPNIVVLDCPRSSLDFINYQAIENVKNGMFFSPKYEGVMCTFNPPHIICMANEEPRYQKMSADRWDVREIKDKEFV